MTDEMLAKRNLFLDALSLAMLDEDVRQNPQSVFAGLMARRVEKEMNEVGTGCDLIVETAGEVAKMLRGERKWLGKPCCENYRPSQMAVRYCLSCMAGED